MQILLEEAVCTLKFDAFRSIPGFMIFRGNGEIVGIITPTAGICPPPAMNRTPIRSDVDARVRAAKGAPPRALAEDGADDGGVGGDGAVPRESDDGLGVVVEEVEDAGGGGDPRTGPGILTHDDPGGLHTGGAATPRGGVWPGSPRRLKAQRDGPGNGIMCDHAFPW